MRFLKVPEGCIRRANIADILQEVISYYKLKTVKESGYFRLGTIPDVATTVGVSSRTVSRWLQNLVEVGLAYRDKFGYGLVKYDTLFSILGYDMTMSVKRNGKVRLGSFKIFMVSTSTIDNLIPAIAKEEASLNMSRQRYVVASKLTQKINQGLPVSINTDITLSCFGLAKLLGYKSKSTGHRIENLMECASVLIDRRIAVVEANPYIAQQTKLGNGTYLNKGAAYRVISNKIHIH